MKIWFQSIAALILAIPPLVQAQAPANNNFAARATLPAALPATVAGTTANATAEAEEPAHAEAFGGNVASNSVWYRWTPTATGWADIGVDANYDSVISVYTGTSLATLVEVDSSDRFLDGVEDVFIQFAAGTTYSIAVDGFSETTALSESGAFSLSIRRVLAPANDNFANATILPSVLPAVDFDRWTILATGEPGEPQHVTGNTPSNSVWYRWTAPADAFVGANLDTDFDSEFGSDFDCLIAVYSGNSLGSLVVEGFSDVYTADSAPERAVFFATEGVQYWIAIDGYSDDGSVTNTGRFILEIYEVPLNDDFFFAEELDGSLDVTVAGTTLNGSSEYVFSEPDHGNGIFGNLSSNSVWYMWTAPSAADMTLEVKDVLFDPVIAVYTGNALEALTEVAAADAGGDGDAELLTFTATAGVTYTIAVDAWSGNGRPAFGDGFTLVLSGTAIGGGPAPFETWIANYPSLAGVDATPEGNPSGDGIANLTKLVLGLDPTIRLADDPNRGNYPVLTTFNSNPALRYVVVPDNLGTGAQTILHGGQVSNDMGEWFGSGLLSIGENTWVAEIPSVGADARFGRIVATIPAAP